MGFAGMSYLAVIGAAVAAWLFGAVWYMTLSKRWMAASGWKSEAEMLGPSGKVSPVPFAIAFAAELVMAYFLAGLIAHLGAVTVWRGLVTAFFVWLAFVMLRPADLDADGDRRRPLARRASHHGPRHRPVRDLI